MVIFTPVLLFYYEFSFHLTVSIRQKDFLLFFSEYIH